MICCLSQVVEDDPHELPPIAKTEVYSDVEFLEEYRNKVIMASHKELAFPRDAHVDLRLDPKLAGPGSDIINSAFFEGVKAAVAAQSSVWADYEFAVPRQVTWSLPLKSPNT